MTPLGRVPGARVTRYLGSVSLHFIKESWAASRGGEVASFFHEFVMEASEREESFVVVNLRRCSCCCCFWCWYVSCLFLKLCLTNMVVLSAGKRGCYVCVV